TTTRFSIGSTSTIHASKPRGANERRHKTPALSHRGYGGSHFLRTPKAPTMPSHIEDYALIGDCETAALVARDGSIDWLCFPRFDSPACFAALLGTNDHGRWKIAPSLPITRINRRYRPDTLVLETEFETESGKVALIDCMPPRTSAP